MNTRMHGYKALKVEGLQLVNVKGLRQNSMFLVNKRARPWSGLAWPFKFRSGMMLGWCVVVWSEVVVAARGGGGGGK